MVRLPRNEKQTYWLNSRPQMWPMVWIYQIVTGVTSVVGVAPTHLVIFYASVWMWLRIHARNPPGCIKRKICHLPNSMQHQLIGIPPSYAWYWRSSAWGLCLVWVIRSTNMGIGAHLNVEPYIKLSYTTSLWLYICALFNHQLISCPNFKYIQCILVTVIRPLCWLCSPQPLINICQAYRIEWRIYSICIYVYYMYKADSKLSPIQWETSLQSNGAPHWVGANLESAMIYM